MFLKKPTLIKTNAQIEAINIYAERYVKSEFKSDSKKPNAYTLFCKKERENIKLCNPNISFKELQQELSHRWKIAKTTNIKYI